MFYCICRCRAFVDFMLHHLLHSSHFIHTPQTKTHSQSSHLLFVPSSDSNGELILLGDFEMSVVIENPVLRHFLILFFFSLLLLATPLILLFAGFLLLLRLLLTLYKNQFLSGEYGDFVNGFSNLYHVKSAYSEDKQEVSAVVSMHFIAEGLVSVEDFRKLVEEKLDLFQSKTPVWFPELFQFPSTWFNFAILKKEQDFRVEEHVKSLSDFNPVYDKNQWLRDENIKDVLTDISRVKFTYGKSPWEFFIHHNLKANPDSASASDSVEGQTIIFGRFHHMLSDGFSFTKFLSHLANTAEDYEQHVEDFKRRILEKNKEQERNLFQKLCYWISMPLLGLYELPWIMLTTWDRNPWHPLRWPKLRHRIICERLGEFNMGELRRMRQIQGHARLFDVMATALSASLRKYMSANGIPIPEKIHSASVVPILKNPAENRLTNSITSSMFSIPLGLNDRRQILKYVQNEIDFHKKRRGAVMCLALFNVLGIFPEFLKLNFRIFTTMVSSNFPAFPQQVQFCGKPISRMYAIFSPPPASLGVYFLVTGYAEKLYVNLGLTDDIVSSREQMKEISKYFQEEIKALENPKDRLVINPLNAEKQVPKNNNEYFCNSEE